MISLLDQDFAQLNIYLNKIQPSQLFILVDENTHHYCLPTFLGNLETNIPFEIIELEAGEEMKTIETASQLWQILAEFNADRKSLLINLGGGVITDLGGFVASIYKRGIGFINIPTTLLGMCDASIGGKTGVDFQFFKNLVGTFSAPEQIFVYPNFLKTLPFTELRSGFAEMLKHGLVAEKQHWDDLASLSEITPENVHPFIERSMRIKNEIVQKDYKENNVRKILNFGHTVGHAIESLFLQNGKTIPHGEAVALGMICETRLSFLENLIPEEIADKIISNILSFFPVLDISWCQNEDLLNFMKNDKKNLENTLKFSLLNEIGTSIYDYTCEEKAACSAIDYYRNIA